MKNLVLLLLTGLFLLVPVRVSAIPSEGEGKKNERRDSDGEISKYTEEKRDEAAVQESKETCNPDFKPEGVVERRNSENSKESDSSQENASVNLPGEPESLEEENLFDLATLEQRVQEAKEVIAQLMEKGAPLKESVLLELYKIWANHCEHYQQAHVGFSKLEDAGIEHQLLEKRLAELVQISSQVLEKLTQSLSHFSNSNDETMRSALSNEEELFRPEKGNSEILAANSLEQISLQPPQSKKNEKAKQWLTEKAFRIFVKHYYSLDWIREFLLEMGFSQKSLNGNDDLADHLILCVKTASELLPTVRGVAAIEESVRQVEKILTNGSYYYRSSHHEVTEFCQDTLYHFGLIQKANETEQAQHHHLASLWRNIATKKLGTFAAWQAYALAKEEEARVMGYQTEKSYWEKMKSTKPRANNRYLDPEIISVGEFHHAQKNQEDFIKNYRDRAQEAKKKRDDRLAALWTQIADHIGKEENLDQTNDQFMAAWCLTKAANPHQQDLAPLWRIAADYFHRNNGSREVHASSIANSSIEVAKKIATQIKKQNSYVAYLKKKADGAIHLELAQLWRKGSFYFQDATAHLVNAAAIENDNDNTIRGKLDALKSKIERVKDVSLSSDPYSSDSYYSHFYEDNRTLDKQIGTAADHWKKAIDHNALITALEKENFPEVTTLLREKMQSYQKAIKNYFDTAESRAKGSWEEGNLNELRQMADQVRKEKEKMDSYERLFTNCRPYLEKIESYASKFPLPTAHDEEALHSHHDPYSQAAHSLSTILHEFISNDFYYSRSSYSRPIADITDRCFDDHDQAIKYGEEALQQQGHNEEGVALWKQLQELCLERASWRKNVSSVSSNYSYSSRNNNNGNKSIEALSAAEKSIQEAIDKPKNRKELLTVGEELQRAAHLFVKAEGNPPSAASKIYLQAAQHLNDAAQKRKEAIENNTSPREAEVLRSASDLLVEAAIMMEEGREKFAEIKEQEAALTLLYFKTSDLTQRQRITELKKLANHPQLTQSSSFIAWKRINDRMADQIARPLAQPDFTAGSKKQQKWNQKGQAALLQLHKTEETLCDFLLMDLRATLEGNEKNHHLLNRAAQAAELILTNNQEEVNAAKYKREFGSKLAEQKKELEQLFDKYLKAIETQNATPCESVGVSSSALEGLDGRLDDYFLKILEKKQSGSEFPKQIKTQLEQARQYYEQAVISSASENKQQTANLLEATRLATDALEQWITAATEKEKAATVYNKKEDKKQYALKAEAAEKKARKLFAQAKEKAGT